MNNRVTRLTIQLSAFLLGLCGRGGAQGLIVEPADIIVIHGRVYTEIPSSLGRRRSRFTGRRLLLSATIPLSRKCAAWARKLSMPAESWSCLASRIATF